MSLNYIFCLKEFKTLSNEKRNKLIREEIKKGETVAYFMLLNVVQDQTAF